MPKGLDVHCPLDVNYITFEHSGTVRVNDTTQVGFHMADEFSMQDPNNFVLRTQQFSVLLPCPKSNPGGEVSPRHGWFTCYRSEYEGRVKKMAPPGYSATTYVFGVPTFFFWGVMMAIKPLCTAIALLLCFVPCRTPVQKFGKDHPRF
eukprot:TRINITY_DN43080_c0_g1_i1.p1 TRINITY_DN43080_c0_g1~~TRINITY_DN43080_c0_g1_i1.p1  ORF type:complete len:148 (-),score=26.60 TRINITY_DN43080_c0_g1_i1:100-543(-)